MYGNRTLFCLTERWRSNYWLKNEFGELYDRVNAPRELNNFWNDPAAADKSLMLEMIMRDAIAHYVMTSRAVLSE